MDIIILTEMLLNSGYKTITFRSFYQLFPSKRHIFCSRKAFGYSETITIFLATFSTTSRGIFFVAKSVI